jgi:hypothetical protein
MFNLPAVLALAVLALAALALLTGFLLCFRALWNEGRPTWPGNPSVRI